MDVEGRNQTERGSKFASPLLLKRAPQFTRTLKKSQALNPSIQPQENVAKNRSKNKKNEKGSFHKKSISTVTQEIEDDDFGFLKNKVEIINKPQDLKPRHQNDKENTLKKVPLRFKSPNNEKCLLKEVSNKTVSRATIPSSKTLIPAHDIIQKGGFKPEEIQMTELEADVDRIFEELGVSLTQIERSNFCRDKNVLNNLNILCLIQKNLTKIAQRKKEYLTEIFKRKSFSIDSSSHNSFQKFSEDSQSIQQPPIDDYTNRIDHSSIFKTISHERVKNDRVVKRQNDKVNLKNDSPPQGNSDCSRTKSVCLTERNLERCDKTNVKVQKKLKTIDFDDESESQQSTINPRKIYESQQSANSTTTELIRILSNKHNKENLKKSSVFLLNEDSLEYSDNEKDKSFLREFVINYPLSKKKPSFV